MSGRNSYRGVPVIFSSSITLVAGIFVLNQRYTACSDIPKCFAISFGFMSNPINHYFIKHSFMENIYQVIYD